MKKLLLILLLPVFHVFGQKPKLDTVFCDCLTARNITINDAATVNKTINPPGPGANNEISESRQRSKYTFEREHHSAWYKLIIKSNGHLCFDIIPNKPEDDYDFMLFKAGPDFCDSLSKYKIKPLRACISRNKEENKGKTGINNSTKKEFVKEGIGDAYVSSVKVNKGEVYYLVLDNVYENGEGHSIKFFMEETVLITGVVLNENNTPVMADIALTNQKGDTMVVSKSDQQGNYSINAGLRKNTNYTLNFYRDSSMSFSKSILIKEADSAMNIKLVLSKLKKRLKYNIGSINFYGGSTDYIPAAVPSLQNLKRVMQKNSTLMIKIIGHTNGCEPGVDALSRGRAERIKKYLTEKGIDQKRIKTEGRGCKEMLFQLPWASYDEQEQNRRVEIMVLEY